MFYLTNYKQKGLDSKLSKKVNGPFEKDVLSYSFIKNELTIRVTK